LKKIRLTVFKLNRENKMTSLSGGFGRGGDGGRRNNSGPKKRWLQPIAKIGRSGSSAIKEFIYRTPFFVLG